MNQKKTVEFHSVFYSHGYHGIVNRMKRVKNSNFGSSMSEKEVEKGEKTGPRELSGEEEGRGLGGGEFQLFFKQNLQLGTYF